VLLDHFFQYAARDQHKVAVVSAAGSCTYGELRRRALNLANYLRPRIAPGDRVALVLENSADYIACSYGIWAAGGVVAGLNTALQDADILHLLAHCGARHVAIAAKATRLRDTLAGTERACSVLLSGEQVQSLHGAEQYLVDLPQAQDKAPMEHSKPHDLAMLVYTSGTTGAPKGVMLSHANLEQNTAAIVDYLDIRNTDRVMCVLPFYYSYGNSVLHTHIRSGATLVLENSLMYPHRLLEQMQEQAVTAFYGVPSTFNLLLARTQPGQCNLGHLRYCAQAGGAMDTAKIDQWCSAVPNSAFVVMYGQTEASARLAWLPPAMRTSKPGSVGIAIPGVELAIEDPTGQQQPPGVQGEVCVRGNNVMQGYWHDRAATDEVLRNGWLHTGDLGYLDEDGYLYLVGRSREMIKSGAHRISPREIEDLISSIDGVSEVAVIGIANDILGQVIKACVIAETGSETLRKTIQRHCREHLAAYKVPKHVEFYLEFPRTASGKIQKHLLASEATNSASPTRKR
jgi:acyl-CoA synthetase (AMP-forming)/AMP-acid ligase II